VLVTHFDPPTLRALDCLPYARALRLVQAGADENVDDLLPRLASSMLAYVFTPFGRSGKPDDRGIKSQQSFIVAAFGVGNLTADRTWQYDLDVMAELRAECGLHVLALTGDGAAVNRQVVKNACDGTSATDDVGIRYMCSGAYEFGRGFCVHPLDSRLTLCFPSVRAACRPARSTSDFSAHLCSRCRPACRPPPPRALVSGSIALREEGGVQRARLE
jgi:hypothetical protein